jgi:eukaryotic-like serine/threonine-protein kinase
VVDTRKDPWALGQLGCTGVRPLVLAYSDVPKSSEPHCVRNLTMVPDLSGQTSRRASRLAEGQGLLFQAELVPAKPGQPIGVVVDQVPDPGVSVPFHDPVRVFIPVRVPLVVVPFVTGTRSRPVLLADAVAQLQTAGFKVAIEDQDPRTGFPSLAVVGQDTDPGEAAPAGSLVTLAVVGNAHAPQVPRLIGLTLGQARARLAASGLAVAVRRSGRHRSVDSDHVVSADIPPGTRVAPGTVITVGVASH